MNIEIGDRVRVKFGVGEIQFTVIGFDQSLGQLMICGPIGCFNAEIVELIYKPKELV